MYISFLHLHILYTCVARRIYLHVIADVQSVLSVHIYMYMLEWDSENVNGN